VVLVGVFFMAQRLTIKSDPFGYLKRPEKPIRHPAAGMSRVFTVGWNFIPPGNMRLCNQLTGSW
jgi:hypothetical protein